MLKINFKLAVRTMWKNRFYSLINILGLVLAQAACIIAFMYFQEGDYLPALPATGILLLVCINYLNIATVHAGRRAGEEELKKAIGCGENQMSRRLIFEGILCGLFAFFPALFTADALAPLFEQLSGYQFQRIYSRPVVILFSLLLSLFTGLIAGTYQAVLAAYVGRPWMSDDDKGKFPAILRTDVLRKVWVVFQFAVAISFIFFTLTLKQTPASGPDDPLIFDFKNLASNTQNNPPDSKTAVIISEAMSVAANNFEALLKIMPGRISAAYSALQLSELIGEMAEEGKNFIQEYVQEKSAEAAGSGQKKLSFGSVLSQHEILEGTKNQQVLEDEVTGRSLIYNSSVEGDRRMVSGVFQEIFPAATGRQTLQKLPVLLTLFSTVALGLACMGLFKFAACSSEKRSRESGIRRLMGASVGKVALLQTIDYLKLILISMAVAVPVIYLTKLHLIPALFSPEAMAVNNVNFIFAGILVLLSALASVAYQTLKTSFSDSLEILQEDC